MYLKSIVVQGFKSFANKIEFELLNGITCIVGPNGSGKSNVADAVRWVFGEQSSRQLRSTGMPDLIFAGTELRKPQSFAEVSITLDNTDRAVNMDFDEVTVSRKVYRSGESEYRLNGAICRLKDINELFYDTGIGKEGYSIIGQGQVDRILSARPEERRELFDEACGIVKFKKRKAVTLKKLQSERDNMLRLTDILSELERQVGPLKRQSETAKEYLKLRDELRSYDINAFLIDEKALNSTLEKVRENLKIGRSHLEEERAKENRIREEYQAADAAVQDLEAKLEYVRNSISASDSERADAAREVSLLEEKIKNAEASREKMSERITEIEAEIHALEEKKAEAENALESLSLSSKEIREKYDEKLQEVSKKEAEIQLYEDAVEASQGRVIDLLQEQSDVRSKLNGLKTLIEQNTLRIREYEEKIAGYQTRKEELTKQAEDLKAECDRLMDENAKKNEALTASRNDVKEATSEYNEKHQALNDLLQKIQIEKGRLESLKAIRERYEGFQPAVKKLMELKGTNRGIRGTVAELVSVEPKYQTLIETALGGNYQNVVVDTEATAKQLIEVLKENRYGRATFLPLQSIRSTGGISDERLFREPGVIGTCDTLVASDPEFHPAIEYLLDRFLAVDTMDHALQVARKYHYSVRMVTLEGEFLNVGGSITGGSYKSGGGILGRNDEILRLENAIKKEREQADRLEKEVTSEKQYMDSCILEEEELEEALQGIQLKLAEAKANYDSVSRQILLAENETEEYLQHKKDAESESNRAAGEAASIETALKNIEKANSDSASSKDETTALLKTARDDLEALSKEAEELNIQVLTAEQKADFLRESADGAAESIAKLKEDRVEIEREIEESKSDRTGFEEELAASKEKLANASTGTEGLNETVKLLTEEKEKAALKQRTLFEERDRIAESVNGIEKENVRLENQEERTEDKLEALTEYLWSEYEMTPTEAASFEDHALDDVPQSQIRKHANELKAAIKNLGNVNVNAIEDYKAVSERYEFLSNQYQDIQKAEKTLVENIEELDQGMRKQFLSEFERIKTEFDVVYKDLFRGGSGTLLLDPEADVIDADVSIISQPPGKKLQNMMQLSGGEKALTAIALIFAIQHLKPSPFVLLDEIEAALDDANIVRFNNYLKQLSSETQYIVITHRRGTMLAANRLYGITMQEKGVSTLVSVNLVEAHLE